MVVGGRMMVVAVVERTVGQLLLMAIRCAVQQLSILLALLCTRYAVNEAARRCHDRLLLLLLCPH